METDQRIVPYDLTGGEKVHYGHYAVLEGIFRQFISELESFFLDEFRLAFQLDFEIKERKKFRDYLGELELPLPLIIFGLSPLQGDTLLVMENRFANLILSQEQLTQKGKIALRGGFRVDANNYTTMQRSVDKMLRLFAQSWTPIIPCRHRLKRLVSHRFKAKVMHSEDVCVVVTLKLQLKGFTTYCDFCFSSYQLDPLLKKYGKKTLLTGDLAEPQPPIIKEFLEDFIFQEAPYEVSGVVGTMKLSHQQLIEHQRSGTPIPLDSAIKDNILVKLNGVPMFSASPGVTLENLSLQLNGTYTVVKDTIKKQRKRFQPLQFPKG